MFCFPFTRSPSEVGLSPQCAAESHQEHPSWGAECTLGQAIKKKKGENDTRKDTEHLSVITAL